ncbi:hypothetical protein PLEOSDRAFT_158153 [Pleurotus ostreatus PC15]|uniref:Uncharacterized protein n=1 Tax=Pleurotus ostreatus (strain PC15) TaxID=1137138 RepID=A0A067NWH1_PLEO1|nr:hypothetical protein PLEOSDRAFT_158153 [Pleurotus ostreatus PC15]
MHPIRLPLELILRIIPFLDDPPNVPKKEWEHIPLLANSKIRRRSGPPSLSSCSLVCHAWNDICRAYIFRAIYIDCNEDTTFEAFAFLHSTAPHLCKYVRELRLRFCSDVVWVPAWMDACLSRFTNLRELELRYFSEMGPTVTTPLVQGIVSLLATISLKRLALLFWDKFVNASDMSRILFACSATLEEFMIDCLLWEPSRRIMSFVPPVVHLKALRRLELDESITPFAHTNTIECPDLATFTISHYQDHPWELPPWIPASISDLNLRVSVRSGPLQFERLVYPSRLTIQLISLDGDIAWLEGNINRLPFHHRLRELTIKIVSYGQNLSSFPESTCYETLCRLLLPHQYPGLLKRIIFNIRIWEHADIDIAELDSIRMRETVRLEAAFSPLSAVGPFSALVFVHLGPGEHKPNVVMQCIV